MKTNFSLCFSFCFILLLATSVNATHLAGGQITYQCTGTNQYQVKVTVYRDCAGIALAAPVLSIRNSCAGTQRTVNPSNTPTALLISPSCAGGLTTCNGGTQPGIQKYDYLYNVILTTAEMACIDIIFLYDIGARNNAVTTLSNAGSQNMRIEAHLNGLIPCHDSPQLLFDPILFICLNNLNSINCSAASSDSLTYSFMTPLQGNGTLVTYTSTGFDSAHAITGTIAINNASGNILMTPTAANQVAVVAVKVTQRRLISGVWTVIGSVMRDIQLYVIACAGTQGGIPPELSGINGTSQFSLSIPPNKTSCFNLFSSCADTSQHVKIELDSAITNSSFVIDTLQKNQTAQFCWIPAIQDTATSHCFIVTVTNNNPCIYYKTRTYQFWVNVVDSGICSMALNLPTTSPSCLNATDGSATVIPSTGIPPYSYLWNTGETTSSITGLIAGSYFVQVIDSNGCAGTGACRLYNKAPYCIYNIVKGYLFDDVNGNGIWDGGELPMKYRIVTTKGTNYTYASQSNSTGFFQNFVLDTGLNATQPQSVNILYHITNPNQLVSNFSGFFNTDSVNFAYQSIPGVQDLRITMIPVSPERINRNFSYQLKYSSVGTDTVSGTIAMIKDSRMNYVSSNPNFLYTNGDSAVWSYANLKPNESRSIDITLFIPSPPSNIGDLVSSRCVIEPIATDSVPNDNYSGLSERIVGSYDPNDKTMLGGDYFTTQQLSDGDYMTYLIRFQNTGNDTAFRVVVKDTLSSKLDASTFEMVSASNEYSLYIENNENLVWTFDEILLPDSNVNEPASHGYLCYRIKPLSALDVGERIYNTAHIFFDFNLPVATNTSVTTIDFPEITDKAKGTLGNLILFPNPAQNEFTILSPTSITNNLLEVYNAVGIKIYSTILSSNHKTISCKQWPAGIYFIRIEGNENTGTMKMVKMD